MFVVVGVGVFATLAIGDKVVGTRPPLRRLALARPSRGDRRPSVDDVGVEAGAVGEVHALVVRDRRVDVRGPHEHAIADAHRTLAA